MSRTNIALIDYGMGNLRSVTKMLFSVGVFPTVTSDADEIRKADKIILPGVGSFAQARANLEKLDIIEVLEEQVRGAGKAYLGICLGMQLLASESLEGGTTQGLDWIAGQVNPIERGPNMSVPHMGWNDIAIKKKTELFLDFQGDPTFYFCHSYNMTCRDEADVVATSEYGGAVVAAVQRDNIFGTQFHPEKSQTHGRILMENFCKWEG